jgi:hypothetical protein
VKIYIIYHEHLSVVSPQEEDRLTEKEIAERRAVEAQKNARKDCPDFTELESHPFISENYVITCDRCPRQYSYSISIWPKFTKLWHFSFIPEEYGHKLNKL